MKILFCGTMVPEEMEYKVKDISAAGNRFQNNLVSNFRKIGHTVQTLSYVGVPLPENMKHWLLEWNEKYPDEQYVVRQGNAAGSMARYNHAAKKYLRDTDIVICYNIIYAWLFLPEWARRYGKKSVAILADYSESISYHSAAGKLYAKLQFWSMRQFDRVVGLSANMEGKLKKGQSFLLMEGGIDRRLYDSFSYTPHKVGEELVLLYSGLLSPVTGVDRLLEAMKAVGPKKVRLLISGKGILEGEVRRAAEEDARICFLGHLPYEEYIRQLGSADILINPRNMELPENQNNFPSKIMDYLAAGKKIFSTKFAGWECFRDYIDFCDSCEEMMARTSKFAEKPDMLKQKETFSRNRSFAETFLWENQMAKILNKEL